MDNVNKTLYIPLYGKAFVSKRGLFLKDKKAEEIWAAEAFPLKGKSKSKWLAYYMGIRSAVFDEWLKEQMEIAEDALVLHLGCGMDSRILRVGNGTHKWYDIDFPEVIRERSRYFQETDSYTMLSADVRQPDWLQAIPQGSRAVIVMEGISMYLNNDELKKLLQQLSEHFGEVSLLMDCYSNLAAKLSKYKNPINDVGVSTVYGLDDPALPANSRLTFVKEHDMTPQRYIEQLHGMEKNIFRKLYAGNISRKLYHLWEYRKTADKI